MVPALHVLQVLSDSFLLLNKLPQARKYSYHSLCKSILLEMELGTNFVGVGARKCKPIRQHPLSLNSDAVHGCNGQVQTELFHLEIRCRDRETFEGEAFWSQNVPLRWGGNSALGMRPAHLTPWCNEMFRPMTSKLHRLCRWSPEHSCLCGPPSM